MKRVMFVASDNGSTSGAFLCMVKLCQLLKNKYGCYVCVILPNSFGDGKRLLDEVGIKTYLVKSCTWAVPNDWSRLRRIRFGLKMTLYNYPAIKHIRRIIREEKIDIVHVNTSWSYVGAIAAKKEDVKLIWHLREVMWEGQNREFVFPRWAHNVLNCSDLAISVSDYVFDAYKNVINGKLVKIYEGIDSDEYYRKRVIFNGPVIEILNIGWVAEPKGQWQLIEAAKKLVDQKVNCFHVSIVGRGEEGYKNSLLKKIYEYNLEEYVDIYDATSDTDSYYKKADIFVMSSKCEAFGRTTVEAMLEGCLVIGSDGGATPDLLDYGNSGVIYSIDKTGETLAHSLAYAMQNIETMRALAVAGQQRAVEIFSADNNAMEIQKAYEVLLKQEGEGGN